MDIKKVIEQRRISDILLYGIDRKGGENGDNDRQ